MCIKGQIPNPSQSFPPSNTDCVNILIPQVPQLASIKATTVSIQQFQFTVFI